MKKDMDVQYLKHIQGAIKDIQHYTRDGKDAFFTDRKTQDAVIRKLEIIGEATIAPSLARGPRLDPIGEASKKIGADTKQKIGEIPWKDIAGARDVFIHGYFKVDLNEVWKTVTDDLPVLDRALQKYTNRIHLPVQREKDTDLER